MENCYGVSVIREKYLSQNPLLFEKRRKILHDRLWWGCGERMPSPCNILLLAYVGCHNWENNYGLLTLVKIQSL